MNIYVSNYQEENPAKRNKSKSLQRIVTRALATSYFQRLQKFTSKIFFILVSLIAATVTVNVVAAACIGIENVSVCDLQTGGLFTRDKIFIFYVPSEFAITSNAFEIYTCAVDRQYYTIL